ncbi:homoserine dehydrogenase [Symbiobacterium terraclitae]|uniref:Homoserine dehydrogenase n=1 Tax=Symbiobacterium terraclitae TaxID=557451 RepID=A0ABS4JSI7_9FIRM|nr:homoserine dehydrogenase [Symbiobacterium terraclitae]MBP2017866.1 homoserine dehydrogenase [Symbiobacterium terraclitae]
MEKQTMRIAILGLGTVGSGVVRLLRESREMLHLKTGLNLELAKVLVRDARRPRPGFEDLPLTDDVDEILGDPSIRIVVELMGGIEPARTYMVEALKRGKTVVTANKDVMADYDKDLYDAGEIGDAELYFEASVGGGIPIIRPLKESLAANRMELVMGIVNGTTNYILTQMSQYGKSYEEALREAQELGYAEPDPTNDVQGYDAARKLAILSSICFLSRVKPGMVYTEGITRITPRDIEYGRRFGWVVKLLAIGKEVDGKIEARVHPAFIPEGHPLANVSGSLNAVFTVGDPVGESMFFGRGAGAGPTASAVVSDLIAAALSKRTPGRRAGDASTVFFEKPVLPISETRSRYYLRLHATDAPGSLARIAERFGLHEVSLAQVVQGSGGPDRPNGRGSAELVLVTHTVQDANMQAVVRDLKEMADTVISVDNVIRVEG